METQARPVPQWLGPVLWAVILSVLGLSAGMLWFGAHQVMADRRIQAAGLTAEARIVRLQEPSHRANRPNRSGFVTYRLVGGSDETRSLEISRDTWAGLQVGQTITLQIDPANPHNHQFDRDKQVWTAWTAALGGLVLGGLSLGLLVWALRGGLATGAARRQAGRRP